MDAASLLKEIRSLSDLPRLVTALSCTPAWEEVPRTFWAPGSEPIGVMRSALVGWQGTLPWYGVEAPDASRTIRRLAAMLERRGEPAALLALDPGRSELVLSVAFEKCPALPLLPLAEPRLLGSSLARIRALSVEGALATAARLAEILGVRGLGERFFQTFQAELDRLASCIKARPEDRKTLALLQLNRILFLYFVQSKGWLDGKTGFLRQQVDRCLSRGKSLDRSLLRPLFFGTLNRPVEERSHLARCFGRIPFLNGGLFEPHVLEKQWKGTVPNSVWRETFDQLFERFQFTSAEGTGTAIAPDMLGRVFEGVMAPEERRGSGTFYTPPAMAAALLEECLTALVAQRFGVTTSQAERWITGRSPAIAPLLADMTLLDPAAGSGAFLLTALDRLTELQSSREKGSTGTRRRILRNNLFGVDVNPTAVRLTELRLWLSVIADDPTDAPGAVEPLPNLDGLIRQGDSLTDPLGMVSRMPFRAGAMGHQLRELRSSFSMATGEAKRAASRRMRDAEHRAMEECLELAEGYLLRGVGECLAEARSPDLFGVASGAGAATRRLAELRRQLIPVRQARRGLRQNGEIGWFQYESHFADVFNARGGFDVIIGNPPWVRAEKLAPRVREQLSSRYHWWKGDTGKRSGYAHQPDLAVAFLERAHELAAPGGVVGLLLPAKIATADYGRTARRAIARDLTLHAVADLAQAFPGAFDATVYPMAVVSGKVRPDSQHVVRLALGDPSSRGVAQQELSGGGPWPVRFPEAAAIAANLGRRFSSLRDRFTIHLGVKTGANEVFLHPPESVEPELVRRAFRGRDVTPFRVRRTLPMLWPYGDSGEPLDQLPTGAQQHFRAHETALRNRADFSGGPPWTLFRTRAAVSRPRVAWADLAPRLNAVALTNGSARLIPLNTCYVMPVPGSRIALVLAAWLNSTCIRALARLGADPASGGFARFNARAVGALPLPDSVLADAALAEWAKGAGPEPDQRELDDLTASHLDLSAAELRVLSSVAGIRADHRR